MLNKLYTPYRSLLRVSDSVVDQGLPEGCVVVEGKLSDVDVVSPNGYRYRRGFWDKVLSEQYVKDAIRNREMLGMVEHPVEDAEYLKTPYEKASHVVLSVVLKDSVPFGRFALLNNQKGNAIKALVELGVPVGVSTRGLGEQLNDSISPYIDETNYALLTWDFTNSPNFPQYMERVSDSLRQQPLFRELVASYGLKDSDAAAFQSDKVRILGELRALIGQVQSKLGELGLV